MYILIEINDELVTNCVKQIPALSVESQEHLRKRLRRHVEGVAEDTAEQTLAEMDEDTLKWLFFRDESEM